MAELSIALVLIAAICWHSANKWLDLQYQKLKLNSVSTEVELSAALEEKFKQFDQRINKSFEHHQIIKTEMDALKLAVALKGK